MQKLPHELYSWIDSDGFMSPGTFRLDSPLRIPPNYLCQARNPGETFIGARYKSAPLIELNGGGFGGAVLRGGGNGIRIMDGSRGALIWDCSISGTAMSAIMSEPATGTRIQRTLVNGSADNGMQFDNPTDLQIESSAIIGEFDNKALDMSGTTHGRSKDVKLIHLTIVSSRGYGVGLGGWFPNTGNVMMNCAIFAPPPGPGASGYGVLMGNGANSGTFLNNVVYGGVVIPGSTADVPGFDTSGNLATDLPYWYAPYSLAPIARIRPSDSDRMWSAALRTAYVTKDLQGAVRTPKGSLSFPFLKLACGAVRG